MKKNAKYTGSVKAAVATALLGGFMIFAVGAPTLRADDDGGCRNRIIRADHRLHEAAEHHGWDSPQAQTRRAELAAAREFCWSHAHRWWDEDSHRWHTDRDWDDHDHDHR